MKTPVLRPASLSDDALLARLVELVGRGRRVEAELVWHLAEVDARRLYLREACPSMHAYATERLHLSDAEAYLRITVARVSRRFPVVLAMLADGRLHLSAVAKLAPHLRDQDGKELLARAVHRSKREIDMLLAELAPRADVPSLMRRLPTTPGQSVTVGAVELRPDGAGRCDAADRSPMVASSTAPPAVAGAAVSMAGAQLAAETAPWRARMRPPGPS